MTWDFFMLIVVAYSIIYTLLAVSFAPAQTDQISKINLVVTFCFAIDLFLSRFLLIYSLFLSSSLNS